MTGGPAARRRRVLAALGAAGAWGAAGLAALSLTGCRPGAAPAAPPGGAAPPAAGASPPAQAGDATPATPVATLAPRPSPTGLAPGQAAPILVGAAVSATGSGAEAGRSLTEGYKLWEEQVNRRGGLLGRPVQLTLLDDASDPSTGTRLYEQLINETRVDLLLGPYASSTAITASTVSEKYKIPLLAAGAPSSDLWKRGYKYVFGLYAPPETHFNGLVDLAVMNGYQSLAILFEGTVIPAATAAGTAAYAKARGMRVVFQDRYPTGATDVSALLSKIKDLNPDVVAGGSYVPDSELIIRQARTLDVTPRAIAFSAGAAEPDFGAALGPDADYVLGPSMWEPTLATPGNPAFVESYQQRWGRPPDARAAAGFAAGQVLEAAVQQAGGLRGEALRNALASLETPTVLPGTFKADPTGAPAGHLPVLVQWQGKQRPVVWPESLQTAPPRLPMPAWKSR